MGKSEEKEMRKVRDSEKDMINVGPRARAGPVLMQVTNSARHAVPCG